MAYRSERIEDYYDIQLSIKGKKNSEYSFLLWHCLFFDLVRQASCWVIEVDTNVRVEFAGSDLTSSTVKLGLCL